MMGTIGEVAIVPNGISTSIMDSHLLRIRPNTKLCTSEYISWLIKGSSATQRAIHGNAHGAIMKGLNSKIVRNLPAPLPPPSEQRRIVEILDQADELRKKRAEADAKAARILPALFYEMFGDPVTNPKGWNTRRLDKLFSITGGGTPRKSNGDFWNGTIPWVSPKDMKTDLIGDAQDHITEEAIANSATNLVPKKSILVVYRSGILAHSFPVSIACRDLTINQDLKALNSKDKVCNEVLYGWLKCSKSIVMSCVKKGATVHNIDGSKFKSLQVMIPDADLQENFREQLDEVQIINAKRESVCIQLEDLFNVLLYRAFSGDLTVNWREAHMKELLAEMEIQAKALN